MLDAAHASSMFRGRLRKRGAEGVSKKGPLIAKHPSPPAPSPSSSPTPSPPGGLQSSPHHSPQSKIRGASPSIPVPVPRTRRGGLGCTSPDPTQENITPSSPKCSPVRRIYGEGSPHTAARVSSRIRPASPSDKPSIPVFRRNGSPSSPIKALNRITTPNSPCNVPQSPGGSIPRRQSPVSPGKDVMSTSNPGYDRRAESPTNGSSIPRKIKYMVNQHNGTGPNVRPANLNLSNKETGNSDLLYQQPSNRTNASPTRNTNYSSTSKNYNQPRGPSPNSKIGLYQRYNNISPVKDKRQLDQSNHPSGIPRREPSPTQPSQSTSSTPRGISPNSAISAASSMSNIHRNPSPGNGNRGTSPRGASPGSRCSSSSGVSDEVIRGRVRRAVRARLYLLHQPGPNSFSVGGDSPSHKYKVIIGPQSCSCGHSPYCVHVLFVMVRVLQVPENSSVLLAGTLKDYEVEQLLSAWEERRKKAVRAHERRSEGSALPSPHGSSSRDRSSSSSSSPKHAGHSPCGGADGGGVNRGATVSEEERSSQDDGSGEEEEAQCPICLTVMVEGESLVACETGCRNLLHHHCMAVWAADRHSQKLPLLCPLCRASWPSKGPKQKPQRETPDTSLFGGRSALSATSHTRFPSTPTESTSVITVNHRRAFSADETPMQESGYGTVGGLLPASSVNMNSININIVNSSREINNSINSNFDVNHNSGRPSLSSRHLHNQMQSRASPVQTNSKSAPLMRRKERRDVENRNLYSGSSRTGGRESPSNSRPSNPIPRQHNQSPSRLLSPSIPTSRNSAYRSNARNTRFTPLDIGNSFSVVNSRNINSRNGNEANTSARSRIPSSPSNSISSNSRNNNRPNYTNLSNPILTNTNQSSSANSRQPFSKRMSPTPGMVVPVGVLPGAYYPPTLRGEVSAAMVANVGEDEVPLPRSEPIPVEHEESAATWVAVFGRELVGCLFSRDWAVRETGLRRLAHEVVKVLHWDQLVTGEETRKKVVHCCANILAQVVNDPVYKVYLACLRVVRCLLSHLTLSLPGEVSWLQELLRPLLHTLLLKCADGNRRTSQISVDSLLELSRGQEGELALGGGQGLSLGGVQYVLSCILDEAPPQEAPWQWLLGRLCVLDRLLDQFPQQFQIQMVSLQPLESGYKLQHYDRLMTVVEFAFKALGSSHATVAKLARRVYICGAKMAAAEPNVFRHVCDMLGKLDISLQMRLKRRLRSLHSQHVRPVIGRLSDNPLHKPRSQLESNLISTALPRLVRSVSHSPSRLLAKTRSPSNSPCRNNVQQDPAPNMYLPNSQLPVPSFDARNIDQPIPSTSTANTHPVEESDLVKAPDNVPAVDQVKQSPPRPNHLPLDSIHLKFKDKQAKVKQYHKSRPRQEEPIIVQHALITPKQYRNSKPTGSEAKQDSKSQSKDSNCQSKKKNQSGLPLRKGGLSQSHGNNLDLSPRTPVGHTLPKFTLKEAIASPSTPDPPFTTPVKEVMLPVLPQQLQSQVDSLRNSEEGAGSDEPPEIPLPKIPNLTLIPPYLEHDVAGSQERIAEAPCLYEENVEWKRGQMLGSGAFSCCYQARDIATGSLMAVKVVSFVCNSSEEQERVEAAVEDEILLMSQLRHRNIVRLFGSVRYSTSFCVFTEWMAGGSVSNLLEKYGAFSEAVILRYTKQVLMGLSYLHDNMILHRDLKGANLLIDSTGDWLRIGDFGTAARLAHKSTIAGEFQGQLLGTIAFMAPEVLRGDNYGRACDIWSVGCCIIEMASTKPPWDADHVSNQFKLMFKIATSNGPPLVPEQLSESMRTMVLNCLQTISDNRPSSKDLLGSDLFASIKISAK